MNTIDAAVYYSQTHDEVVGFFALTPTDYYSFSRCPANGVVITSVGGPPDPPGGRWASFTGGNAWAVDQANERIFVRWYLDGLECLARYDMIPRTWSYVGNVSGTTSTSTQEMAALVYVPEWGSMIHRIADTGVWRTINATTAAAASYTPAGLAPPLAPWPGNKLFYYPARRCVVYVTPTATGTDAIYVMRTGAL